MAKAFGEGNGLLIFKFLIFLVLAPFVVFFYFIFAYKAYATVSREGIYLVVGITLAVPILWCYIKKVVREKPLSLWQPRFLFYLLVFGFVVFKVIARLEPLLPTISESHKLVTIENFYSAYTYHRANYYIVVTKDKSGKPFSFSTFSHEFYNTKPGDTMRIDYRTTIFGTQMVRIKDLNNKYTIPLHHYSLF